VQAVEDTEKVFLSVFGDKDRLSLTCVCTIVAGRIKADCASRKVGTFVTAFDGSFLTASYVGAQTAVADRGIGATIIVGAAGAAPLSEKAVIT